jgi:hypothetical protein
MRLKIQLPPTWAQKENGDGPATFCRADGVGPFQVSWAEYRGRQLSTDVTTRDSLKKMAERFGQQNGFGHLVESSTGTCPFGMFGTGVFQSAQHPRIQVWIISDGRDHIMATHICIAKPDSTEIAEAQQIAASLALGPEQAPRPRWKFW